MSSDVHVSLKGRETSVETYSLSVQTGRNYFSFQISLFRKV
jgi:hypothetical protein